MGLSKMHQQRLVQCNILKSGGDIVPAPISPDRSKTMGDKRANKEKQAKRRVKAVTKAEKAAAKAMTLTGLVERKK